MFGSRVRKLQSIQKYLSNKKYFPVCDDYFSRS